MHDPPGEEDETTAVDSPGGRLAPASMSASMPGARIGRFVLLRRLGAGGMGVVYSAYDEDLDRRVAIKLMHRPDTASAADRGRMRREAQALAKLSHPHVVAIYEVGEHEGSLFLAMEYVQGPTLREWLDAAPRAPTEILGVLRQAGEGLAAAHDAGLVHRDFKPGNVLVADDGRTRVLDFGLARNSATTGDEPTDGGTTGGSAHSLDDLTEAGTVMGTPPYMPPEQFAGGAVDARSDQWSFCVTVWEALYGQRPFHGVSYGALATAVREGRVVPPPSNSAAPPWIQPVLMRGLWVDPERRHPDMRTLIAALDRTPRRRGLVGLGALGLVGVLGVGYLLGSRGGTSSCVDAADRLEPQWNPGARDELREAFVRTEIPHAEASFATAARRLDDFAATWKEVHLQACEIPSGAGTTTTLFDLELACLDTHQRAFRAVVEVLARADAGAVEHAVQLAASLPSPRHCGDAQALLADVPPPPPELAQPVGAVRDRIAAASAEVFGGHVGEAEALARTALAEAATIDYAPLEVEAKVRLGTALSFQSQLDPARQMLEDAYWQALRIGHDQQAIAAAIVLIHIVGDRLQRVDEGRLWFRQGEALAARHEIHDVRLGWLFNNAGNVELRAAHPDEARAWFERALAIGEHADPPDPSALGSFLNNLGTLEYKEGNLEAARRHLLHSLEIREASMGPTHPSVVSNLVNLGNVDLDDGRIDEAKAWLTRALEVIDANDRPDTMRKAYTLLGLGRVLSGQGQHREALEQIERARVLLPEALGPEHPMVGMAMVSAGQELDALGHSDEALARVEQGLGLAEPVMGAAHPDVLAGRMTRAGLLAERGEHEAALAGYRGVVADAEGALGSEHAIVGRGLEREGMVLLEIGRADEAVVVLERALVVLGEEDAQALVELRFALARALRAAAGDEERARRLAQEALAGLGSEEQEQERAQELRGAIERWLGEAWGP